MVECTSLISLSFSFSPFLWVIIISMHVLVQRGLRRWCHAVDICRKRERKRERVKQKERWWKRDERKGRKEFSLLQEKRSRVKRKRRTSAKEHITQEASGIIDRHWSHPKLARISNTLRGWWWEGGWGGKEEWRNGKELTVGVRTLLEEERICKECRMRERKRMH